MIIANEKRTGIVTSSPIGYDPLGLYSLSGKMSYRQISWTLEAPRSGIK